MKTILRSENNFTKPDNQKNKKIMDCMPRQPHP